MTIKEVYKKAVEELKAAIIDEPGASAEFLLRHVLEMSKTKFFANLEQEISSKNVKKFNRLLKRRKKHEPVWQIVGKVEFWGLDFAVNQNVLVPRPETEFLVEAALRLINTKYQIPNTKYTILDVGTGAGTIPIAIASEIAKYQIHASDVSGKALNVAKKNAKSNGVADKITFKKGSLLEPWKNQKFDIITANLPYIPTEDLGGLALEVHHYEPRLALDGGRGGLVLYEEFLKAVPNHLNKGGSVFCEIGKGQGEAFCALAKKYLPKAKCEIKKDLAGFDRIAIIST